MSDRDPHRFFLLRELSLHWKNHNRRCEVTLQTHCAECEQVTFSMSFMELQRLADSLTARCDAIRRDRNIIDETAIQAD